MSLKDLKSAILGPQFRISEHPVYSQVSNLEDLEVFMQYHVFAVWDFMSLLKSLQAKLTCVTTPWLPPENPRCSALINRIVVEEESDVDADGNYFSHFEMYHQAMTSLGFDTTSIDVFLEDLKQGVPWKISLRNMELQPAISNFVEFHLSLIESAEVSTIAAVFAMTREDLVPVMFEKFLQAHPQIEEQSAGLKYYLDRHIELDGGEHSSMAEQMLIELCDEDDLKWEKAINACKEALELRAQLWDGVVAEATQASQATKLNFDSNPSGHYDNTPSDNRTFDTLASA